MPKNFIIGTLALALVLTLGGAILTQQNQSQILSEEEIRTIVSDTVTDEITRALEARDAQQAAAAAEAATSKNEMRSAAITSEEINPMIESFLMDDPKILQRVSDALQAQLAREEQAQSGIALAALHDSIYNDADHIVLGNPEGDVTLVEFFDYNCHYCRRSLADLEELLASDPNLKVIMKEFPILSENSLNAARVSTVAATFEDFDYWSFHSDLLTARGQVDQQAAIDAAVNHGLTVQDINQKLQTPGALEVLTRNYALAQSLSINGTPSYIIGDEIIRGAIGVDELRMRIKNLRECGKNICDG